MVIIIKETPMKKVLIITLIFILAACLVILPACSKDSETAEPVNYDTEQTTSATSFFFSEVGDGSLQVSGNGSELPENIVIPSVYDGKQVTVIQDHAFKGYKTIKSVVLPASITQISLSAFYDCDALTEITIPKSVTTIQYIAFYGCHHLKTVNFDGTINEWKAISKDGAFYSDPIVHCTDGDFEE